MIQTKISTLDYYNQAKEFTKRVNLIFSDRVSQEVLNPNQDENPRYFPSSEAHNVSGKTQRSVRWSQKRDSYVAAISSTESNLDELSKNGELLTMEEILLLNREREGSLNQEESGLIDMVKWLAFCKTLSLDRQSHKLINLRNCLIWFISREALTSNLDYRHIRILISRPCIKKSIQGYETRAIRERANGKGDRL